MRRHTLRGVAAVEFALILPLMLLLCLGITELGRALYQYDGVVKATRGAARYLTQQNLSDPAARTAAENAAKSLAVCGQQSNCSSGQTIVPGLSYSDYNESKVAVEIFPTVPTGEGVVSLVSVTIGGSGAKAVKFKSLFAWVIPDIEFSAVKITMAYSTT